MNLFTKRIRVIGIQTNLQIPEQKVRGGWWDKLGDRNQHIPTTLYIIDN